MRERSAPRGSRASPLPQPPPSRWRPNKKPTYGIRTPGLCPDLSRPLTSDLHISYTDKDQTSAQSSQPQKPRTSEQKDKAVSRGATWRRPDGLPRVRRKSQRLPPAMQIRNRNRKHRRIPAHSAPCTTHLPLRDAVKWRIAPLRGEILKTRAEGVSREGGRVPRHS